MTSFLSVDNMKTLLEIMGEVMKTKYNQDIPINNVRIKNIFLTIMQKVDSDVSNDHLSLVDKNKLTLRIVREILKSEASMASKTYHTTTLNRDQDLNKDREPTLHNHQPSSSFASGLTDNTDVATKMNQLKNMREQENVKETHTWQGDHIEDKSEPASEFKEKIDELELSRTDFDSKLKEMLGTAVNNKNFMEQRNEDMSSILNKSPDQIDPTAFFKQNDAINHQQQNYPKPSDETNGDSHQNVPSTYQNLALATIIDKSPVHEGRKEKKFVLINSYDRNWIVDKQRYKYKVRFSYSTNDILRVPYYENNPTVPHTKTEKSNGIPNDFGWVDKNGTFYPPYDPALPLSSNMDADGRMTELGFEEVEIVVDQDASMIGTFKNIHSIQITNVSIPTEIFHTYINTPQLDFATNKDYNFNFNFPYILCNIDEFQDIYDGTDDTIRKSFCQLQFKELVKTPNGRGYIILKPVQNEKKVFYPNPLSTLPTLNISLTKPNGELLNMSEDGLSILAISTYQSYYLKVTTKTYFEKDAFYHGDYVRIKNFNLYQITSSMPRDAVEQFNRFINRKEGHVVYEVGTPNESGYYNSFHIFGPGHFDKKEGRFVVNATMTDAVSQFHNFLVENKYFEENEQNSQANYENGFLLNMSLQNSISMTVEMYKPDSIAGLRGE